MTELKVLLVEDNQLICQEFVQAFADKTDMKLIGITNNSFKGLSFVRDFAPHVVLLDLELHAGAGSGFEFLDGLRKMNLINSVYVLVTTHNISQMTHAQARQLGADFIMTKSQDNYSAESVLNFISTIKDIILNSRQEEENRQLAFSPSEKEQHLKQNIALELNQIGIPPNAVGRKYLSDCIQLVFENFDGKLYNEIANRYQKSLTSVERAMQNAIEKAWNTTDILDLELYYTARIRSTRGVPTIMEFIHYYVEKIRINNPVI